MKILALLIAALCVTPAAAQDLVGWGNGVWGVAPTEAHPVWAEQLHAQSCSGSPLSIRFDRESMRFTITRLGPTQARFEGDILEIGLNQISMQYDNEKRTFENGDPQIWHMHREGEDEFIWILAPMTALGPIEEVSGPLERCRPQVS